jgi:hypothetical protein
LDEDGLGHRRTNCLTANYQGYSLYVGSAVPAEDFEARERLLRYCARSPLSLERLSLRPDGNVEYRVKQTRHGGQTMRIMTPLQFMARLAALVAPPRHPLLRFFGVFVPLRLACSGRSRAGPLCSRQRLREERITKRRTRL